MRRWDQCEVNECETGLDQLEKIVGDHQCVEIDGVLVDAFTASLRVQGYHKLNEANQVKFLSYPVDKMARVAWALVA